jgi:pilus assembly protein CpaE
MARGVFLMTGDSQTEKQVGQSLLVGGEHGLSIEITCRSLHDLVRELNNGAPAAVLVDIDNAQAGGPERMLGLLDPVISRFAETRFVVLASKPRQDLLLEAMQVGARHFVAKESISADLVGILNRIIPSAGMRRGGHGFIAAVLSASGGTGATVLAVNLANELRQQSRGPTLLVDMDCFSGAAAGYLGLSPSYSMDVVLSDPERIDGDLIKSSSAIHEQNLYVLESPKVATKPHAPVVPYENLGRFIAACKDSFPYTVFDAPRLPLDVAAELASNSNLTLIPFELTVAGIRAARELMSALVGQGCSGELLTPVIARYKKPGVIKSGVMISYEEACKALGRPSLGKIENDFAAAVESINFGKPLSQAAPRSVLRKAMTGLAMQVHQAHASGQVPVLTW